MKTLQLIPIMAGTVLFAGCAAERPISDMAAGAGGGFLAADLSNGNPAITAAGAAGGVLVSEGIHYAAKKQADKASATAYEKGRSDAVKQQYWVLVNQQKSKCEPECNVRLYEIPVPEQEFDGVKLDATTNYLRIEE
jgi:hypothetical protein